MRTVVETHTTASGVHSWRLYLRYRPQGSEGPYGPAPLGSLVSEKQERSPAQRQWLCMWVEVCMAEVVGRAGGREESITEGSGPTLAEWLRTCLSFFPAHFTTHFQPNASSHPIQPLPSVCVWQAWQVRHWGNVSSGAGVLPKETEMAGLRTRGATSLGRLASLPSGDLGRLLEAGMSVELGQCHLPLPPAQVGRKCHEPVWHGAVVHASQAAGF